MGELYKELIIADVILTSIFEELLVMMPPQEATSEVSDITIEAALILINKLGWMMEERAKSLKNEY
jgi:hypothetical protein